MKYQNFLKNCCLPLVAIVFTSSVHTAYAASTGATLEADKLGADPMVTAMSWLQDAKAAGSLPKYSIMGTWDNIYPDVKLISLGKVNADGYVFTLTESSGSAREISEHPNATFVITWADNGGAQKQIRLLGKVTTQGAANTQTITYQEKQMELKSATYVLKPEKAQFATINFAAGDKFGIAEFVNYKLENGTWKKMDKKTIAFDNAQRE